MRRFPQHVLPSRFARVRYYGFLANRDCPINVAKARALIASKRPLRPPALTRSPRASCGGRGIDSYALGTTHLGSDGRCGHKLDTHFRPPTNTVGHRERNDGSELSTGADRL
ncbi:MAG: transposase [Acidobacteriota bacterium]